MKYVSAAIILLAAVSLLTAQGMGGFKAAVKASNKARLDIPGPKVEFRDIASGAGLTEANIYGGIATKRFILEMTGNGVAVVDFDNDGKPDVFFVNGTRLAGSSQEIRSGNRLYRNEGNGNFRDITAASGLNQTGWGQGVCAGDFDNDGLTDLFATYYGHDVLYRNVGDGRFEDVTAKSGLPATGAPRWGTGCAFLDYDRDGYLDLFVASYLDFDLKKAALPGASPFCTWKGLEVFCGPRGFAGGHTSLYHNHHGSFTDSTQKAGVAFADLHYGLGVVSSDFDNDGWPDIYVACDSTRSVLYRKSGRRRHTRSCDRQYERPSHAA